MLNDEICKLREKLNESIITGQDYNITYKLSIELDELIAKYYSRTNDESKNKNESSKYQGKLFGEKYATIR